MNFRYIMCGVMECPKNHYKRVRLRVIPKKRNYRENEWKKIYAEAASQSPDFRSEKSQQGIQIEAWISTKITWLRCFARPVVARMSFRQRNACLHSLEWKWPNPIQAKCRSYLVGITTSAPSQSLALSAPFSSRIWSERFFRESFPKNDWF